MIAEARGVGKPGLSNVELLLGAGDGDPLLSEDAESLQPSAKRWNGDRVEIRFDFGYIVIFGDDLNGKPA